MHEESNIANTHDIGSPEYYDEISKKKRKSQGINFQGKIWETLDQKPNIGNLYFLDSVLFESCRIKAEDQIKNDDTPKEKKLPKEQLDEMVNDLIIQLYEEKFPREDGGIEVFNIANYVPASLEQIHDITFKTRMFRLTVQSVAIVYEFFPIPSVVGQLVPFVTTRTFQTTSHTLPMFTESHERMTGQIHVGNNLTIDTTRIMRQGNGTYLIKLFSIGNNYSTNGTGIPIGVIAFGGGSIPIVYTTPVNSLETPVAAFGFITEIDFNNNAGEIIKDAPNWSLSEELERFENEKIEAKELSLLAQQTLIAIEDSEEAQGDEDNTNN